MFIAIKNSIASAFFCKCYQRNSKSAHSYPIRQTKPDSPSPTPPPPTLFDQSHFQSELLNVSSSEMDPTERDVIQQGFIKGKYAKFCFREFSPPLYDNVEAT
jgi:hypothetical protein